MVVNGWVITLQGTTSMALAGKMAAKKVTHRDGESDGEKDGKGEGRGNKREASNGLDWVGLLL
jgi:hypothetical protein